MAWIYLVESVESDLPLMNTLQQSRIVKTTDTLKAFCCPGCNRVTLIELQSGMTSKLCERKCCHQSTLSLEVFPVKISVLQELVKAWVESEVVFSTRLSDLQKKLTRRLCSWKTFQQLELEDFEKSSEHLPKSGMTVDGLVFLPVALEPHISVKDGSYLPTPTAQSYGTNKGGAAGRTGKVRMSLETMARANFWPTPTVHGNYNRPGSSKKAGLGLATAVKLYPTPAARDWRDNGKSPAELARNSQTLATIAGGQLNPMWVEWLMGYPIAWTELNASVTQWFHSKSKRRLKNCAA